MNLTDLEKIIAVAPFSPCMNEDCSFVNIETQQFYNKSRTALPAALALIREMREAIESSFVIGSLPRQTGVRLSEALANCAEFEKDVLK